MPHISLNTPLGAVTIFDDDGAIVALEWGRAPPSDSSALLDLSARQLHDYFDGTPEAFTLPLKPRGTPYQSRVWHRLAAIPYATTVTYGTFAAELSTGPRAIARACAANPIPIIIPCHRVVAANGHLGGYTGGDGPETKRALLCLEGVISPWDIEDAA